jgi:predicted MFS family arabinose efflux permease
MVVDMPALADAHERGISTPAQQKYLLFLLFALFLLQTLDRGILQILLEPIKHDLDLSDSQLGFLVGPAFALVFAVGGIPLGRSRIA